MRLLPPQRLRPHYYEGVEQTLGAIFREVLFDPLKKDLAAPAPPIDIRYINQLVADAAVVTVIMREGLVNTTEEQADAIFANTAPAPSRPLVAALRRGTIQYTGDLVTGDFDAKLSAALRGMGATFDVRAGGFRLPVTAAPAWFKTEAAAAQARAQNIHKALERELDRIQERLETGMIPLPIDPTTPIEAIEDGFEPAAAALSITKRIPAGMRAAMEARYAADIRPYVTTATSEYIDGVHKAVADNAARGYRYETIVDDIQHFVGVSERKARFLARQETSLFMAHYREERFTGAGVTRYQWSTSHDIRVRPYADDAKRAKYGDHRVLDKQIFTYAVKAPAQYMSSKKPCNPGEDFGCRCADLAVLE